MKISQTIITIICAAVGSWITIAVSAGAIVNEVHQNTTNYQEHHKRLERLETFIIDFSISQAETRSDVKYIKEQINDIHYSRGSK